LVCFSAGSAARIESYMKDEMRSWGVDESFHCVLEIVYATGAKSSVRDNRPQPANVLVLLPKDLEEAVLVVIKQYGEHV
jgi:hypothetical protein